MNSVAQIPCDLSIIIASRNDDHGDHPLKRLQAMIDNLAWHAGRLRARWELILVEWNPPADRPALSQVLSLPGADSPLRLRIIRVDPALHKRLPHSDRLPFFQMIAKNVGGRRARGKFLLFTNMDILFSEPLANWLASPGPQKGKFYRTDRSDCDRDLPAEASPAEVLRWAASHRIRHNGLIGTYPVRGDGKREEPRIVQCSGVTLGRGWSAFHERPAPEILASPAVTLQVDGAALARGIALTLAPGPGVNYQPVALELSIHHPKKGRLFFARNETGHGKHRLKIRMVEEKVPCELRITTGGLSSPSTLAQSHPWRLFAITALGENEIPLPSTQLGAVAWNDPADKANEIVEGEGVSLLGDWHPAEVTPEGVVSRWAGLAPVIELACPKGSDGGRLTITAHPGPGVGAKPFWLEALDENGRCLRRVGVVGWRTMIIHIAARERDWVRVRLVATPQGYRTGQDENDPRALNFAVSKIHWYPSDPNALVRWKSRWDLASGLKTLVAWVLGKFRRESLPEAKQETLPMVHMNNCGDFTLVDRDSFLASGGHSEEGVFSLNLDTLFLYRLVAIGLKEEILQPPCEIFHIEHGHASGATPEGIAELTERIRGRGIPVMELKEVFERARAECAQFANPQLIAPPSPDWGFASETLSEESFGSAVLP